MVIIGDEEAAVVIEGLGTLGDAEFKVVAELFGLAAYGVQTVERESPQGKDAVPGPCGIA